MAKNLSFTCDRCRKTYEGNVRHVFQGGRSPVTARRISLLGGGNYIIEGKDICDECIDSFFDWWKGGEK